MDYLFYDIFKDGKTPADTPLWLLKDESNFYWASTRTEETIGDQVPSIKNGFSVGRVVPIGNIVSVFRSFNRGGRFRGARPVVTWYVVVTAKKGVYYASAYELQDALQRVFCGKIFDVVAPEQGKVLRIKANVQAEVEQYISGLPFVKGDAVDVEILRTTSQIAWEIFF
ncbi:hypothetical protein BO82DRAFT_384233 [Aspergillus uvarum CBS 121591]|uniref:Uncharacterized protein n=1 Tax=Aspergillus uvarum CBS 121591 TaxID=1448315 RepID=A0A319DN76_9EURO|nr:hypothetical protein BO82DRAFT_384233 [Aspergillus uvarum CBS 121591]PYH80782.1 hypothetical protein BO82DRAFT_384233 [Aspergillus uvarum CBS 121591]